MYTTLTNAQIQKLFIAHSRIYNILMGYKTTLRLVLDSSDVQNLQASEILKTESLLFLEDAIIATEETLTALSEAGEKILSQLKSDIAPDSQIDLIAQDITKE